MTAGMWAVTLVVMTVTTWRATRLLVRDELPLIKVPRDAIANYFDPPPEMRRAPLGAVGRAIAYLVECPWCMSVWVAGGLTAAVDHYVGLPAPWLSLGAVAAGSALITLIEGRADERSEIDKLTAAAARADARRRGRVERGT